MKLLGYAQKSQRSMKECETLQLRWKQLASWSLLLIGSAEPFFENREAVDVVLVVGAAGK